MTFKEARLEQKSQYGRFNWLKYKREKTYGPVVEDEDDKDLVIDEEDDYKGADHD